MNTKTISEFSMLTQFKVGEVLLGNLIVRSCEHLGENQHRADARIELGTRDGGQIFKFAIESKARSTPQAVLLAITQAKSFVKDDERPMVQVPYLSEARVEELIENGVSGVDLCGNGAVIVEGQLFVVRTGRPNLYRDSRPVSKPQAGLSSLVCRHLLSHPSWPRLTDLVEAMEVAGAKISFAQVSKVVQALAEDLILLKEKTGIRLCDPLRLMDKLGEEWRHLEHQQKRTNVRPPRRLFRVSEGADWIRKLSSAQGLKWAVTGESSVSRYALFSQAGPLRIAVSDIETACNLVGGSVETIPNFADIELIQTNQPGMFFDSQKDEKGVQWASPLQTWLELQAGDARQREAAQDIQRLILTAAKP